MGVFGGGVFGAGVFGASSQLALTEQDVYPTRGLLAATGLAEGNVVTISRRVAGSTVRTVVRGAEGVEMEFDSLVRADAEAPYGVEVTYYLTVDGLDLDTVLHTYTLEGAKVALSDAISGAAAEVVVLSWPEKRRERASSVFAVGGRNIVVAGQRSGFSGSLDIFVETDDSKNNLLDLLNSATSGVLQIRCADGTVYNGFDAYFSVLTDTETRWSEDGSDERRIISLDVVETSPWAPTLDSSTFDYADVATAYTGLTYADLAADFPTYLDVALGDFS
jgi:hypothetical protein